MHALKIEKNLWDEKKTRARLRQPAAAQEDLAQVTVCVQRKERKKQGDN